MSARRPDAAGLLALQLRSVPMLNEAVRVEREAADKVLLTVSLEHHGWSRWLRRLLPLSMCRRLELDRLGAEVLSLCDGQHTVEEIIDRHRERWQLSFFEARGMVFSFLRRLMRHDFVVLVTPAPAETISSAGAPS